MGTSTINNEHKNYENKKKKNQRWPIHIGCLICICLICVIKISPGCLNSSNPSTDNLVFGAPVLVEPQQATTVLHNHDHRHSEKFNSAVKFVFVVGIEGTGHHFMGSMIKESPTAKYFESIGVFPRMAKDMALTLTNSITGQALLNAHCDLSSDGAAGRKVGGGAPAAKKLSPVPPGPDVQIYANRLTGHLQKINAFVENKKKNDDDGTTQPLHFAMNTWQASPPAGELSFPNGFQIHCRNVAYPNLDLIYDACKEAEVDCAHVYIYRDPYSVIRSSQNRNMHQTTLQAIHLYITHLYIIYGMMASNGAERTLGCWGIMTDEATEEEVWGPIRTMFGWSNQEFQRYFQNNFKAPMPLTKEQKDSLVPPKLDPYFQSLKQVHQSVIDLCRAQVAANNANV